MADRSQYDAIIDAPDKVVTPPQATPAVPQRARNKYDDIIDAPDQGVQNAPPGGGVPQDLSVARYPRMLAQDLLQGGAAVLGLPATAYEAIHHLNSLQYGTPETSVPSWVTAADVPHLMGDVTLPDITPGQGPHPALERYGSAVVRGLPAAGAVIASGGAALPVLAGTVTGGLAGEAVNANFPGHPLLAAGASVAAGGVGGGLAGLVSGGEASLGSIAGNLGEAKSLEEAGTDLQSAAQHWRDNVLPQKLTAAWPDDMDEVKRLSALDDGPISKIIGTAAKGTKSPGNAPSPERAAQSVLSTGRLGGTDLSALRSELGDPPMDNLAAAHLQQNGYKGWAALNGTAKSALVTDAGVAAKLDAGAAAAAKGAAPAAHGIMGSPLGHSIMGIVVAKGLEAMGIPGGSMLEHLGGLAPLIWDARNALSRGLPSVAPSVAAAPSAYGGGLSYPAPSSAQ